MILVGTIYVVVGNYLPKLDYVKNYNLDTYKARKINRFMGFASVIMGLLFMLSIFFDAIVSVIVLVVMFVCVLVCAIYALVVSKGKK